MIDPKAGLPKSVESATLERVRTMADRRAVLEGCRYDQARVDRVVKFMATFCRHSKGRWAGQPLTMLPWQVRDVIEPLFGWVRPDGYRRHRRCYIEIGKKNGKSTLCAGLALYLLVGDSEPGAEVYCAAFATKQAKIVYEEVERMVKASPHLKKRLRAYPSSNRVVWEERNSFAMALSRDSEVGEGINAHGLIFDELHVQKTRQLWDSLEDSGTSRTQPLLIAITTAGEDQESVCYEQHRYVRSILEGAIDDPVYHGVIYAAEEEADYSDPDVWRAANPSMGYTFDEEVMAADYEKARASPGGMLNFRRRRLCQWVGGTSSWLEVPKWVACQDDSMPSLADLRGQPAWMGLDLGASQDMTAAVMLVQRPDERWAWFARYWCPEDVAAERERTNRGRFLAWAAAGHLRLTPGEVTDYAFVEQEVLEMIDQVGGVRALGYDPWSCQDLANRLDAQDVPLYQVRQTYPSLSLATKRLAVEVIQGHLVHGGDPVSRWCVGNTVIDMDPAGNVKPSKKKSTGKIDGVVAGIMALACYLYEEEPEGSPYDADRGLVFL